MLLSCKRCPFICPLQRKPNTDPPVNILPATCPGDGLSRLGMDRVCWLPAALYLTTSFAADVQLASHGLSKQERNMQGPPESIDKDTGALEEWAIDCPDSQGWF